MDRDQKRKLADALDAVATDIEREPKYYKFTDMKMCQVGLLVSALGVTDAEMTESMGTIMGLWGQMAFREIKPIDPENSLSPMWQTISENKAIAALQRVGLTAQDVYDTERLANTGVCIRAKIPYMHRYGNHENVIKYFRAWAEILRLKADWGEGRISDDGSDMGSMENYD